MFVHEEGFWEGSTSELRFFDLRNFRSYIEADEDRNQQFADVIPTGRLIELCK
jgi:hypothetical protein